MTVDIGTPITRDYMITWPVDGNVSDLPVRYGRNTMLRPERITVSYRWSADGGWIVCQIAIAGWQIPKGANTAKLWRQNIYYGSPDVSSPPEWACKFALDRLPQE